MREAGRGKNVGRERMGKTEDEEECGGRRERMRKREDLQDRG